MNSILLTLTLGVRLMYANSATGNDANACVSAISPCQTLNGTLTRVKSLPMESEVVVNALGTFTEAINVQCVGGQDPYAAAGARAPLELLIIDGTTTPLRADTLATTHTATTLGGGAALTAIDAWKGYVIEIVSGVGIGQKRLITESTLGAVATVSYAFSPVPTATSHFVVHARGATIDGGGSWPYNVEVGGPCTVVVKHAAMKNWTQSSVYAGDNTNIQLDDVELTTTAPLGATPAVDVQRQAILQADHVYLHDVTTTGWGWSVVDQGRIRVMDVLMTASPGFFCDNHSLCSVTGGKVMNTTKAFYANGHSIAHLTNLEFTGIDSPRVIDVDGADVDSVGLSGSAGNTGIAYVVLNGGHIEVTSNTLSGTTGDYSVDGTAVCAIASLGTATTCDAPLSGISHPQNNNLVNAWQFSRINVP